jgi:DinB superfamily
MTPFIQELEKQIHAYLPDLLAVPEINWQKKTQPNKWSKKEILGHLLDSAYTNLRRFVVAQYEETPKIVYNQDKCVAISNYQHYATRELIELWHLVNKHIIFILKNMSAAATQRTCETEAVHTLEWLAADYNRHMVHHMHALLEKGDMP